MYIDLHRVIALTFCAVGFSFYFAINQNDGAPGVFEGLGMTAAIYIWMTGQEKPKGRRRARLR